jgi:WD repeat-containing protein 26
LFPRKVFRAERETIINTTIRPRRKAKAPAHTTSPTITDDIDAEDFPVQLQKLADDLVAFLDCLNEFPEFTDEALNAAIIALEGDLKVSATFTRTVFDTQSLQYWASCLKAYEGTIVSAKLRRFYADIIQVNSSILLYNATCMT